MELNDFVTYKEVLMEISNFNLIDVNNFFISQGIDVQIVCIGNKSYAKIAEVVIDETIINVEDENGKNNC